MQVTPYQRRKKALGRFSRTVGEAPACVGHYAAGDVECDGMPPCLWRGPCRAIRDWAATVQVDVAVFLDHTPTSTVLNLAFDLIRISGWSFSKGRDRNARAFGLFLEAFQEALPATVTIAPNLEAAVDGDFYVAEWKYKKVMTDCWMLRYRRIDQSRDPVLFRYYPGRMGRVTPSIELHAPLDLVLRKWPQITPACVRWSPCRRDRRGWQSAAGWACAHNVRADRIPDFGRLAAALLLQGVVTNMGGYPRKLIRIKAAEDVDGE